MVKVMCYTNKSIAHPACHSAFKGLTFMHTFTAENNVLISVNKENVFFFSLNKITIIIYDQCYYSNVCKFA